MEKCQYHKHKEVRYYDYEKKNYILYECPRKVLPDKHYCEFHDSDYAEKNSINLMKSFTKLVDEAIQSTKPLFCIGFYFKDKVEIRDREFKQSVYFSHAIFDSGVNLNAKFNKEVDFSGVIFNWNAEFSYTEFNEKVDFSKATFNTAVDFSYATFSKEVDFLGATFTKEVSFHVVTFNKETNFSYTKFNGKVNFSYTKFNGKVNFSGVIFNWNAEFSYTEFNEGVDFSNASFNQVHFPLTTFTKKVDFSNTVFNGEAGFGAEFNEQVDFSNAKFSKYSTFPSFSKVVFFSNTVFNGEANFTASTFMDEAHFTSATFSKNLHFSGATFSNEAFFSSAKFIEKADFSHVTFSKEVDFSHVTFSKEVDFSSVIFNGIVKFDINFNEAFFSSAKFIEKADFSHVTFSKEVDFSNTIFNAETNFSGSNFADEVVFDKSRFPSPKKRKDNMVMVKLAYSTFRKRVQFIGESEKEQPLDLGLVSFKGVDLSNVEFHNVRWQKSKGFFFTRTVIIDEKMLDKNENYGEVSKIYNQLRKNYEYRLPFNEASHFFIGELEAIRKSLLKKDTIKDKLASLAYGIYKYLALYGESAFLPLIVWTPILIGFFAFLRFVLGTCSVHDQCNILDQIVDSFASYFQCPRSTTNTLDTIERILSIPILGTAFIAMRRKFERIK